MSRLLSEESTTPQKYPQNDCQIFQNTLKYYPKLPKNSLESSAVFFLFLNFENGIVEKFWNKNIDIW
ncbi:hypothetical protein [uncultured Helicobacter sp.]|uniref:hypothetical protein n=1 Tax=uncultured Helicobacter sp. TaxID=175537 RepID=UPI00374F358F